MQKTKSDAIDGELISYAVMADIIKHSKFLPLNDDAVTRAKRRVLLGNPPGKKGYGDAVNWELLLEHVPNNIVEFYLVTGDSDFTSPLANEEISDFLKTEWISAKQSTPILYTNLSKFFSFYFPHIKLATEMEKYATIKDLITSGSFQNTHRAIEILSKYDSYTDDEIKKLVTAALENSQISWIMSDNDVYSFTSISQMDMNLFLIIKLGAPFRIC